MQFWSDSRLAYLLCTAGRTQTLSLGRMQRKWWLAVFTFLSSPITFFPGVTHQPSLLSPFPSSRGFLAAILLPSSEICNSWTGKVGLCEKCSHIPAKTRWWQPQQKSYISLKWLWHQQNWDLRLSLLAGEPVRNEDFFTITRVMEQHHYRIHFPSGFCRAKVLLEAANFLQQKLLRNADTRWSQTAEIAMAA